MAGRKKTEEYNGICRFCGQVRMVQATDQEEADRIATLSCNCDEAEAFRRKDDLMALIDQSCVDLPRESGFASMAPEEVQALKLVAGMIADGDLQKAAVDVADSRCIISKRSDGTYAFKRSKSLSLEGNA